MPFRSDYLPWHGLPESCSNYLLHIISRLFLVAESFFELHPVVQFPFPFSPCTRAHPRVMSFLINGIRFAGGPCTPLHTCTP